MPIKYDWKNMNIYLSVHDMREVLRSHGISVETEDKRNMDGKHEVHFWRYKSKRTLCRILYEYNLGSIEDIQKHRRYFLKEIIEAFDIEERREKDLKFETVDIDVRTLYPSTLYANDILGRTIKEQETQKVWVTTAGCRPETPFEKLIKERIKEVKEMSNNILWNVKDLTFTSNSDPCEKDHFNAKLEGTVVGPICGDLNVISDKIKKKLNVPEHLDSYYITKNMSKIVLNSLYGKPAPSTKLPEIKKVIFNSPATIVIWADETKTIVKAQNNELFDPEKGLAMAITKKALGNEGNYFDTIKKYVTEYQGSTEEDQTMHSKQWVAYQRLQNAFHDKKATKADLLFAIEEAIGYLGEGLDK